MATIKKAQNGRGTSSIPQVVKPGQKMKIGKSDTARYLGGIRNYYVDKKPNKDSAFKYDTEAGKAFARDEARKGRTDFADRLNRDLNKKKAAKQYRKGGTVMKKLTKASKKK